MFFNLFVTLVCVAVVIQLATLPGSDSKFGRYKRYHTVAMIAAAFMSFCAFNWDPFPNYTELTTIGVFSLVMLVALYSYGKKRGGHPSSWEFWRTVYGSSGGTFVAVVFIGTFIVFGRETGVKELRLLNDLFVAGLMFVAAAGVLKHHSPDNRVMRRYVMSCYNVMQHYALVLLWMALIVVSGTFLDGALNDKFHALQFGSIAATFVIAGACWFDLKSTTKLGLIRIVCLLLSAIAFVYVPYLQVGPWVGAFLTLGAVLYFSAVLTTRSDAH